MPRLVELVPFVQALNILRSNVGGRESKLLLGVVSMFPEVFSILLFIITAAGNETLPGVGVGILAYAVLKTMFLLPST